MNALSTSTVATGKRWLSSIKFGLSRFQCLWVAFPFTYHVVHSFEFILPLETTIWWTLHRTASSYIIMLSVCISQDYFLTSGYPFHVISFNIYYKVVRSCLLGSVVELTCISQEDEIIALASNVRWACVSTIEWPGPRFECLIGVTLQHLLVDRIRVTFDSTLLG